MKHDVHRMRENPGAVKRADLIGAMRERGWTLRREGAEHEIWFKRGVGIVAVPRTLKGLGTVRSILDQVIEGEE